MIGACFGMLVHTARKERAEELARQAQRDQSADEALVERPIE
jgi:hypothetical protein